MIYRLDTIKYLIGLGGVDHIMVGTDYPYDLGDWDAAKKIEQLDISEADQMLMLEGNAKRLLRILRSPVNTLIKGRAPMAPRLFYAPVLICSPCCAKFAVGPRRSGKPVNRVAIDGTGILRAGHC